MDTAHAAELAATAFEPDASLEASDEYEAPGLPSRYCPKELLESFALLMAGQGRCVNTSMMLGDREYAMWQLACAQALPDPQLRRVAQRLFSYFDDPRAWNSLRAGA